MRAFVRVLPIFFLGFGCSWTFIQRGPERIRYGEKIDCRTDKIFPLLDLGIAVLYPVAAGARLAAGDVQRTNAQGQVQIEPAPPIGAILPAALAGAGIFAWSAWSGHRDTEHCARLQQMQNEGAIR